MATQCEPSSVLCEDNSVVACSEDGLSATTTACVDEGDGCSVSMCVDGACVAMPQPEGTSCATGVCDVNAACVGCLDNGHCGTGEICMDSRCLTAACNADETVCTSDGTLQTCNADGSDVASMEPCGRGLCDAANGRCYQCAPNSASCDGNTAVQCDSNGAPTRETCSPTGDCTTASCSRGMCTVVNKSPGSSCAGGRKCDDRGGCNWDCTVSGDCGNNEACVDHECQTLCGNGRIDPGEQCEPGDGEWANNKDGCSSSCQRTKAVYQRCESAALMCWPGTSTYFCGVTGSCTRTCTSNDDCSLGDGTRTECVSLPNGGANKICTIACPGGSCASGLMCVTVRSTENPSDSHQMCGWQNVEINRDGVAAPF